MKSKKGSYSIGKILLTITLVWGLLKLLSYVNSIMNAT